jgi:two-component system LytT family response regulator
MLKTLIIDDEQRAINGVVHHLKAHPDYTICGTAQTVDEAIELTTKLQPDLVFLDIVLGTKTGFDYLNHFYPNINFHIIFTTAYDEYAVRAFEYSALSYLLKPLDLEKFKEALLKMNEKVTAKESLDRLKSLEYNIKRQSSFKLIHIATTERYYRIKSKDILYLKSDSNYTHFHLKNETKITASKTLKYYTKILKESHFFKVHKSYLVNTEEIKSYRKKSGELIMNNGTSLTVAVRRQKELIERFFS